MVDDLGIPFLFEPLRFCAIVAVNAPKLYDKSSNQSDLPGGTITKLFPIHSDSTVDSGSTRGPGGAIPVIERLRSSRLGRSISTAVTFRPGIRTILQTPAVRVEEGSRTRTSRVIRATRYLQRRG